MAPKKGADGREKKAMNKAKAEKVKQVAICSVTHAWGGLIDIRWCHNRMQLITGSHYTQAVADKTFGLKVGIAYSTTLSGACWSALSDAGHTSMRHCSHLCSDDRVAVVA